MKIKFIPCLRDQAIDLKKRIAMEKICHGYQVFLVEKNGAEAKIAGERIYLVNRHSISALLDDDRYDVAYEYDCFIYHCRPEIQNDYNISYSTVGTKIIRGSNEYL